MIYLAVCVWVFMLILVARIILGLGLAGQFGCVADLEFGFLLMVMYIDFRSLA
jgi:hypothetical protein